MSSTINLSFLEHLEELRIRIIKSVCAIILFTILSYMFSDNIIDILIFPVKDVEVSFQVLKITSVFLIKIGISFVFGLFLSFPIILYQFLKFVLPAFEKDINIVKIFLAILFCVLLFVTGLLFGYHVLIPLSITFFNSLSLDLNFLSINYTLENYLVYLIWVLIISSSIFQLPFILMLLNRMGIVSKEFLQGHRKHIIVLFFILAALFTPPDPISQILVVIPLYILFEISILLTKKKQ